MPYANNKCADQPAHPRSLISTFVVCCLDSIIRPLAKSKISRPYLVSVAEQAGLSHTWSQTPKIGFLDGAHFITQDVFQRKARINLRAATAGLDLEALELALEKFKKSKLSETDEDFRRASRRLKYLKLKKGESIG